MQGWNEPGGKDMVGLDFSLSALGNVYETVVLSLQDFIFYFLDTTELCIHKGFKH